MPRLPAFVGAGMERAMADGNRAVAYFHGIPGCPVELELFARSIGDRRAIFAPDRASAEPHLNFVQYSTVLAQEIVTRFPTQPIHLIGFSLGAHMALEVAARLNERVARVSLVSAGAPLACGVPLPQMAGGTVFKMARDAPRRFLALSAAQSALANIAPALLARMMFTSAQGADVQLKQEPHFMAAMQTILRHSLGAGLAGYRREMCAYVLPWEDILPRVAAPVTLWHGDQDNWAPPMMAEWLSGQLPNVAALHWLPGKSHYSALAHFWASQCNSGK